MISDKNRIYDGFSSLEGGVDAGRRPNVIGQNQVVSAENTIFRGAFPTTRGGFSKLDQHFHNPDSRCNAAGTFVPPDDEDRTFDSSAAPTMLFDLPGIGAPEANFTQADVGRLISDDAGHIPAGTTIIQVFDSDNALMSANSGANVNFGIYRVRADPALTAQNVYLDGIFQTACYYSPRGGVEAIMALIDGRLFRITPSDYHMHIEEIVAGDIGVAVRNQKGPRAWMIKADKWIIAQDGISKAIIYDGANAHRALDDEVPVGEIMAYGMGRIVVTRNGQEILFGDLYGSHAGIDPGDSVIQFTETTFLSEGFPASIPFAMGRITAASFFPQLDTSTGLGQLLVFTDRGAASFDLSLPRDQWKTSAFQRMALSSSGVRGWRTPQSVNEDLWFRASDGERNFRQARSEANGWYHIPLSTNVSQFLDADTPEQLEFASAIYFDNRLIMTCSPIWNHGRYFHEGLLVLDFDILSSFGTNSRPAWNGHWTKVRVTQLVTGIFKGKRRAFAFALDENDQNQIYEFTDNREDFDGPIDSEIIARAFDFTKDQASNPFSEKELYGGDLWLNNVGTDDADIRVLYRPDNYPTWLPWDQHDLGIIGSYGPITPGIVPTMRPGFFPRLTLEKPVNSADTDSTNRLLRRGFEFHVKINWTGHLSIERFRIQAQQLTERGRANG
jgi:hypothetical protein